MGVLAEDYETGGVLAVEISTSTSSDGITNMTNGAGLGMRVQMLLAQLMAKEVNETKVLYRLYF